MNESIKFFPACSIILIFSWITLGCSSPEQPPLDPKSVEQTAVAYAWTEIISQQTANAPTATSTPPPPTSTPLPTATSTPAPQPIILSGNGDSVVDIQKWQSVALLRATYSGGSNFVVSNYDATGRQIDLLVNTIGSYSGIQMIDIFDNDHTTRFEVKAAGPWELQVLPVSAIRHAVIPGVVQGIGDDVVLLDHAGVTDLFKADASQANSNFIVHGLSGSDYYLMFNEIAPYSGAAISQGDTVLIQVKATGAWSIEVTTK